jgi:hypothetical protein
VLDQNEAYNWVPSSPQADGEAFGKDKSVADVPFCITCSENAVQGVGECSGQNPAYNWVPSAPQTDGGAFGKDQNVVGDPFFTTCSENEDVLQNKNTEKFLQKGTPTTLSSPGKSREAACGADGTLLQDLWRHYTPLHHF